MRTSPEFEVLADLVWALVNDRLDEEGAVRLQQLLDAGPANRRVYIELMDQFASLEWEKGERAAPDDSFNPAPTATGHFAGGGMMNDADVGQAAQPAGSAAGRQSAALPAAAAVPVHDSSFSIHHTSVAYAVASLLLGIGVLVGWVWGTAAPRTVVPGGPPTANVAKGGAGRDSAVVGQVTTVAGCRWADPRTAARDMENFEAGRKFALASGLLRLTYRVGTIVILEGPAVYEVESVTGGALTFGKLTVNVGRGTPASMPAVTPAWRGPFSVRTPTAVVDVRSQSTVFGVEVDRSGVGWVHAFVGHVTLGVAGRETGLVETVPLSDGQLARVEDRAGRLLVTCKEHAASPEMFANLTILPPGSLTNGGKWLKELIADPGVPLIAVGSEPGGTGSASGEWGRQPAADWTPAKSGAGGTGSAGGTPAPGTGIGLNRRSGVIDTCRVTFQIADMVPGTVVLQGRFAAMNYVTAMRLNGTTLAGPAQIGEDTARQSGVFAIRRGFVEGENVWEIDVNNRPPGTSLVVYAQLSGIRPPRAATLAEAFARSGGQEKTTEVR